MNQNRDEKLSEEILSAFVDNQLTAEEKSRLYVLVSQDESLGQRVCELRKTRDLIQLAYADPPRAETRTPVRDRRRRAGLDVAAGILLALGVALGWVLHSPDSRNNLPAGAGANDSTIAATPGEMKVLLHLHSGAHARMLEVLDETESVLKYYRQIGQPARIEIVVNGEGLNLLRADVSPFADRIQAMHRRYDNLTFMACSNTIDRLKREQGIVARLLPQAVVTDSGVAQIMRRQQQGWAYLQV